MKCKHTKVYKYLLQMSPTLWAVVVYDTDDETQLSSQTYLRYKDALYAFNNIGEYNNEQQM